MSELRAHLLDRLPEYMLPGRFAWLDRFPLQAHGKVDRGALPDPDPERLDRGPDHVAPADPTEEAIAAIWADVLELDGVGTGDNFFELGGHSLLATQVVARMRKAFTGSKPPIGVLEMFKHPTVAELAKLVVERRGGPPHRAGSWPS